MARTLSHAAPRRRTLTAACALALAVLTTGCSNTSDASSTPGASSAQRAQGAAGEAETSTPGSVEVIASGLDVPWSVAFTSAGEGEGEGASTALISERDSGRIVALQPDGSTTEVVTLTEVAARGEGGLLGIAVHQGYLYADYAAGNQNRIVRFPLTVTGTTAAAGPQETVLAGIPAGTYHNGGRIAFGPDGMLYATAGDAYDSDNAQDLDSLAGKILRVTPEGAVLADNPFPGSYVYSYGHRNPRVSPGDRTGRCTPPSSGRTPGMS